MPLKSQKSPKTFFRNVAVAAFFTALAAGSLNIAALSARADDAPVAAPAAAKPVTIANRWVAGEKWRYDVSAEGKLDSRISAQIAPETGGMPFKNVALTSSCRLTLDVLEVDEAGIGVVALRTDNLKMRASLAVGAFLIENEQAGLLINDKVVGEVKKIDLSSLKFPQQALRLDSRSHCVGTKELKTGVKPPEMKLPIDPAVLARLFDPRMLPAIWPEKPVAAGDSWQNEIILPLENAEPKDKSAGTINWTYVGEEAHPDVKDAVLFHLQVKGVIKMTKEQGALLAAQLGDNGPATQESMQKISGDVWFDASIGQVRLAELKLQSYNARQTTVEARGKTVDDSSYTIFDGNINIKLRDTPAAATANR